MNSIQNNERSPAVPESIYRALARLMEDIPYEKITITDICRRAGVSRMAYYRHYANKQDIFLKPLARRLEEIHTLWEGGAMPTPLAYWTAYFAAMRRDELVPLILKAGLAHEMDRYLIAHARHMLSVVEGWDLSQQDQRLHLYMAFFGSAGLLTYAFFEDQSIENEALAAFLVNKIHA